MSYFDPKWNSVLSVSVGEPHSMAAQFRKAEGAPPGNPFEVVSPDEHDVNRRK